MPTEFVQVSILGSLRLLEVYEYYDGPRLFSCTNSSGGTFLLLWISSDARSEQYYVVALSAKRFTYIRSGKIDLRKAFLEPEEGAVARFSVDRRSGVVTAATMIPRELDEGSLPLAGEALDLEPLTPTAVRMSADREIIELAFGFGEGNHSSEAPLDLIASCLQSFNAMVNAISRYKHESPLATSIVGTSAGSFAVQMAAPSTSSVPKRKSQQRSLRALIDVLRQIQDGILPEELLSNHRAVMALKRFVKSAEKGPEQIDIRWITEDTKVHSISLDRETAHLAHSRFKVFEAAQAQGEFEITAADLLLPDQVDSILTPELRGKGFVVGIFKLIDLEHNRFALFDPEARQVTRGVIAPPAIPYVERVTLNRPYAIAITRSGSKVILESLRLDD